MPPKESKKTKAKAQAKVIEDKTFGLKNKNRSTKVQKMVDQVQKSVTAGGKAQRKEEAERAQKKSAKEARQAYEAELKTLFKAVDEPKKEDTDRNLGANPEDYLWTADDFEEVAEDDTRLEEKLEEERTALKERTDLTPVTEESFQAWKLRKKQEAADAEKKRVAAAKKVGKLRGKDLWEENADLFVDDDMAEDLYEREEREEYDLEEADDRKPIDA